MTSILVLINCARKSGKVEMQKSRTPEGSPEETEAESGRTRRRRLGEAISNTLSDLPGLQISDAVGRTLERRRVEGKKSKEERRRQMEVKQRSEVGVQMEVQRRYREGDGFGVEVTSKRADE
ncbi:hypothetical protein C8Q78DRAFT_995633 [Trametes maxima]|nr:hypothetical protein C8Q78DRAFT_995633 [Trametes maxima]